LIMHHIVLCTPSLHYLIVVIFTYTGRSRGDEDGNQAEQVQWVFGDPQASSCENTDIA
jgi:hypothetical protein